MGGGGARSICLSAFDSGIVAPDDLPAGRGWACLLGISSLKRSVVDTCSVFLFFIFHACICVCFFRFRAGRQGRQAGRPFLHPPTHSPRRAAPRRAAPRVFFVVCVYFLSIPRFRLFLYLVVTYVYAFVCLFVCCRMALRKFIRHTPALFRLSSKNALVELTVDSIPTIDEIQVSL